MQTIPILELSIVFFPTAFLLAVMFRSQLKAFTGLYANDRMLVQMLLVGFFYLCFRDQSAGGDHFGH